MCHVREKCCTVKKEIKFVTMSDGARPGSQEYFSQYAKGYSTFQKSMTKEEREAVNTEQEKWESDQYPPEVQQKYVFGGHIWKY